METYRAKHESKVQEVQECIEAGRRESAKLHQQLRQEQEQHQRLKDALKQSDAEVCTL